MRIIGSNKTKPKVLEFHRVLPEKLISKTNGYSAMETLISQEYFEEVLSFLDVKGYSFSTVSGLSDENCNKKCIALTFDDGYSDNFDYALPVLQKFNAVATFFPLTEACRENSVLPLDIYYQCVEEMDLTEDERAEYYTGEIKRKFYWEEPEKQMEMLKTIFATLPDKMAVSYMNAKQIKELSDQGHEIGSHGVTHSMLTAGFMDHQKVVSELNDSKIWLESVTGKQVYTFCFPGGRYNASLIEIAKQIGYTSTCLVVRDEKEKEALPSYDRINVKQDSLGELKKALKNRGGKMKARLHYYLKHYKLRFN